MVKLVCWFWCSNYLKFHYSFYLCLNTLTMFKLVYCFTYIQNVCKSDITTSIVKQYSHVYIYFVNRYVCVLLYTIYVRVACEYRGFAKRQTDNNGNWRFRSCPCYCCHRCHCPPCRSVTIFVKQFIFIDLYFIMYIYNTCFCPLQINYAIIKKCFE